MKYYIKICVKLVLIVALSFHWQDGFTQASKKSKKLHEKASAAYSAGELKDAISYSKEVLKRNNFHLNTLLLLADIYNELDSTRLEITYLNMADSMGTGNQPLILYRLGEANLSLGNYKAAKEAFSKYLEKVGKKTRRGITVLKKIEQCKFAINSMANPRTGKVTPIPGLINTQMDEYWPSLTVDNQQLVFTRLVSHPINKNWKQEDFYMATSDSIYWAVAEPIIELNTPDNEGAQTISADGKVFFFTACNRPDGYGSCDIYYSIHKDGKWAKPANAGKGLNTSKWESQPSFSANSGYLYYSSNKAGGYGKKDIWRVRLKGFGKSGKLVFGEHQNLGNVINTKGNEASPCIHFDGQTLYFSSDDWMGFGKSDIFYSALKEDNTWSQPVNLGYPINTHNEEQGFIVDATGGNAYFASDREKENGLDIYITPLHKDLQPNPVTYVKGNIVDEASLKPLSAKVEIYNLGNKNALVNSENPFYQGEFLTCLPVGARYAFNVSKAGYLFFSESIDLNDIHSAVDPFIFTIKLVPIKIGEALVLRNLYFNTDSYEILGESFVELEKLHQFLVENASIRVEIEGHTDSVGTEAYNIELSENRAKAVYSYLTSKGIQKERITWKGYGFLKPVSENSTKKGRSMNRRTEVRITGIGN